MRRAGCFILGDAGVVGLYWYASVGALPHEEGIAHLKTVSVKPFSDTMSRVSPYAVSIENGRPAELLDLPFEVTGTEPSLQYYRLPIGQHEVFILIQTYTDTDGREWELFAVFQNDIRKGIFEITEGQTVTLNPGPPFTVKTDIYKRNSSELSINIGLVGNEGEEYGLRINRSAGKPEIKIMAENGDTLHTGSMEYG